MRATWYVLEDGNVADPSEVTLNDGGRLAHASGLVAMRSHDCPRTRGVEVDESGKLLFGGIGDHDGNGEPGGVKQSEPAKEPEEPADPASVTPPVKTTEMKAEPAPSPANQPNYKRRGR